MGKTAISWSEHTWNPVTGCTKHSPGCDNCYAAVMHKRLRATGIKKYSEPFETVVCHPDALDIPLKRKKPTMYFVNSMSDLFHKDVPRKFISSVWDIMRSCPQHIFQVLTKRPDNANAFLSKYASLPNVWLGTSVESGNYTKRIDILRDVPAAVRFISFEPLIGRVGKVNLEGIHWVIIGGESGYGARPMQLEWAAELVEQCKSQGVACFVKQLGGHPKKRSDIGSFPIELQIREYPK